MTEANLSLLDVPQADIPLICDLVKQAFPDAKLYAFGSRVKGTARAYSDLDLAIDCGKKIPRPELFHLQDLFEESELNYKVDLVDFCALSNDFQRLIETTRVTLN
jgi:predicted nucleotidyltransferase